MASRLRIMLAVMVAGFLVAGVPTARAAAPGDPGGPARAAETGLALSPPDRAAVAQVERYLNSVETLRARFLQVAANGAYAEGNLYLSRPGRMRLEYAPPSPILIVADGRQLIYYDSQLEQVSYIGLDSTPAGILLRPNVTLGGDVTVTGVRRTPGVVEVSMVQTDDPQAGELTLLFTDTPFALQQWKVRDGQGQVVTVSLYDAEPGVTLAPELFKFVDPNFFKPPAN